MSQSPVLEETCPACQGNVIWQEDGQCSTCHNTGRVPTELGRELLAFVERHHTRKLSDRLDKVEYALRRSFPWLRWLIR